MRFLNTFRTLPRAVLIVFFIFLCVPVFSLWRVGTPWETFAFLGVWRGSLMLVTYWCLPLGLCYAILYRHYLFLPLYFIQCVALVLHAVANSQELPIDILCIRYVTIGMMAYVGMLFGDRDFIYPFTTRNARSWRRAPRVRVNFNASLCAADVELKVPAILENCSTTGMAIKVEKTHLLPQFPHTQTGDRLSVAVPWMGQTYEIGAEIVWSSGETPRQFGLQAIDRSVLETLMGEIVRHLPEAANHGGLMEKDMHQTAIALWVLFIIASFALPALATM